MVDDIVQMLDSDNKVDKPFVPWIHSDIHPYDMERNDQNWPISIFLAFQILLKYKENDEKTNVDVVIPLLSIRGPYLTNSPIIHL